MIELLMMASAVSMNCEVDAPKMLRLEGEKVSTPVIGLPPQMNKWKFGVAIAEGQPAKVTLNWPDDPIRAGNATPAVQIGPADYSFFSVHSGPCLFTNTSCVFMFTISVHDDGTADILVQPSALMGGAEDPRREPFQVFMKGRCSGAGAAK
jgi:hypothetical protein